MYLCIFRDVIFVWYNWIIIVTSLTIVLAKAIAVSSLCSRWRQVWDACSIFSWLCMSNTHICVLMQKDW